MSRRFGRNQKRKLREQRDECVDLANRAHRRAEESYALAAQREAALRGFVYEVEVLLGDLRHTTLKPPELTKSETYNGRLELLARARRDRYAGPFMERATAFAYEPLAPYSRLVLEELRAYGELSPDTLGHHMRVQHGDHGASYFLSDRAIMQASPHVFDCMVTDVAKALVAHLVKAKRMSLRPPSTAGLSGTTKEV